MNAICKCNNPLLVIAISVVFIIIGILFTRLHSIKKMLNIEGFALDTSEEMFKNCPSYLIQDDNKYYLFNKNIPKKKGVNPYVMDSLDEYIELLQYQRKRGIDCPVLFIQSEYNIQGMKEYKVQKTPEYIELPQAPITKPLDDSRDSGIYNQDDVSGYDELNLHIGEYTSHDDMFHVYKNDKLSPSPLDGNWGGAQYTKDFIKPILAERTDTFPHGFTPKYIYEENKYRVRE